MPLLKSLPKGCVKFTKYIVEKKINKYLKPIDNE